MLMFSYIGAIRYNVFNYQPKHINTSVQLNVQSLLFKWLSNVHTCGNFFTIRFDLQPDYLTETSMLEAMHINTSECISLCSSGQTFWHSFRCEFCEYYVILWRPILFFPWNKLMQTMVKSAKQTFQMDNQIILLLNYYYYYISVNVLDMIHIVTHRSILIVFSK